MGRPSRAGLGLVVALGTLVAAAAGCPGPDESGPDGGEVGEDAGDVRPVQKDAGGADGGPGDAGTADAGVQDAGGVDAGTFDGGATDAGTIDAGFRDAGMTDAGMTDAGMLDAGSHADAGVQRIGWGNLQWPPYATVAPLGALTVYGQVWIDSVTSGGGATFGLEVQAGFGVVGSDPTGLGWTWSAAQFNKDLGNNDEWSAELVAPASGLFDYSFRYRYQGGPWLYADRSDEGRAGSNDGYQSANAGKMAVRRPGGTVRIATLNLHCLNDNPLARLDAAAARLLQLGVDVVALQEVCEQTDGGAPANSAAYLAQKLSGARTFQHLFAQTHLAFNVTPEGLGIVTALPLARTVVRDLPVGDFPRKTVIAVLASEVGILGFATAHLSFRTQDAQARIDQARAIVAELDGLQPAVRVPIVAGDFNTIPNTAPVQVMTDAGFVDAWAAKFPADPGYTHRSDSPTRRIDYLFVRDVSVDQASREFTQPYFGQEYVSDHAGVAATLAAP